MPASRSYDRAPADIRPVTIDPGFVASADGSALISIGKTRVICTASVNESVPRWMQGRGKGWVTAEYAMLPASTGDRKQRDISKGKQDGRGVEIQRLIGRSLRVVVDFKAMGERSVYVDCDVLEADGGTRCAAITGGYVALRQAFQKLIDKKAMETMPLNGSVAAVSVGMVDGRALCDLDYIEDSNAEVDANVVMTGDGGLVEVQATAERTPLSRASLDELLALAEGGIARLREVQERVALILATGNRHKLAEMAELLPAVELQPLPAGFEMPPEDGDSFAANALIKARAARAATGEVVIADDSGIDAEDLGGGAGHLLGSLRRRGRQRRGQPRQAAARSRRRRRQPPRRLRLRARVDRRAAGAEHVFEARCEGRLLGERRGEGGFGYDPAFVPDDTGPEDERTYSELSAAEKNAISHRGRAARLLAAHLGLARGRARRDPHQKRRGGALDRLQRAPDRAQAGGRGDHRLDRDPDRGDPLADRPGRLGHRLRLGPQSRRAGRRRASLRPREGREPGGDDRGDADPGRRRDHRLRGDPPAGRSAPRSTRSASASR